MIVQENLEPYPGYCLRRLLGRGGFADVWEAQADRGRRLALKFIPCENAIAAPREVRSIQTVSQLNHVNLIHIEKVWCSPGFIIVAMELAEGSVTDFCELWKSESGNYPPEKVICEMFVQVADVLDFLNQRRHIIDNRTVGIQHRDVKPSNMLLVGETVKLCDFGLSTVMSSSSITGIRGGTAEYAAPEVFQGRINDKTDQYALGVSYVQLRTGQLPFKNTPKRFDSSYTRPVPDLRALTDAERPIIARALAPVWLDRWPSCSEMIRRLSDAVA